jgi:hypothetical protein
MTYSYMPAGLQARLQTLVLLMLLSSPVLAGQVNYVHVGNIVNTDLGVWAVGDGDQIYTEIFCTASSNYNDAYNDPPPVVAPAAVHLPYQFKLRDRNSPPGFFLYLDNDDANTGNATIEVTFEHRDTKQGSGWETLDDDVYDAHNHDGQFRNCNNGDNGELRVTLLEADLANARAGSYRGRFRMTAQGGTSGTKTESDGMRIDVEIAEAVRISAIDNVALGFWDGSGDKFAEETFCVYSNNDNADYEVTITSPNQDAGDNFFLANAGATETIPYTLQFKDDTTPGGGTTVGGTAIAGTGNNSASDCGGVDSAKLSVTVLEADLAVSVNDSYSDTVTIFVVPI